MKLKKINPMVVVILLLIIMSISTATVFAELQVETLDESQEQVAAVVLQAPVVTISSRASDGKPRLEWDPVEGAEKYDVYRSLKKFGTYEKWHTTAGNSFVNTATEPGITYYYKVTAITDNPAVGDSDYSNVVYRKCDLPRPKVTITNRVSDGKPVLKWDKIEGASEYIIYRAIGKKGTYKHWYTTKKCSVVNTKTKVGTTYYYKVKAIHGTYATANSAFSKNVYRTCDLPQPIIKVTARLSDAKPKVTWKPVSGAKKYVVYRATSKNGTYKKRITTTKTSYINTSAKAGRRYYYKVVALSKKDSASNSAFSQVKSCKCGQPYIVSSTDKKYNYADFKKDMEKLVKKYPHILKKKYLGKTVDDRGLYSITMGNSKGKKQIFVTAGFHAREYINCQLTMRMIEYYCRNYETGTYEGISYEELFDEVSLCILPMVNPDGIAISTGGPSAIRDAKLRAKVKKMPRNRGYYFWKANARGVDLNNNYIIYKGIPDADTYASEGYPGPKRYSEKETQAVRKAMDGCSNIKAVMNYHSMGNAIYWGYHSKKYKARCWDFAELFYEMTGYYMIDESYSNMARGDFEHYVMHEYKIPYVCIENGKSKVPVPISEFSSIYYKNILGFAKAAYHFYK